MELNTYSVPVIMAICWCIGYIIKKWIKDVDNKYIPTVVAIIGVVLNCWLNAWAFTPDILLGGLASGLASTGLNEMFKQYKE